MIVKGIDFESKKEELDYLVTNKKELLDIKKSAIKYADNPLTLSNSIIVNDGNDHEAAIKALTTSTDKDTDSSIYRTVIGNTYNWLDSHGDVHVNNTFSKSLQERSDKVLHLHDHIYQITAKVGKPISVYEQRIKWADLGVTKSGYTTALMMDSEILKAYNALVFDQYGTGQIDQHSVGMYYVKVDLAVNDPDYEDEYKLYNSYIDQIGNAEKANSAGYFWAVQEAKLIEISAVLQGSNELTPTVEAKDIDNDDLEAKAKAKNEANELARKMMILKQLGC
jgi:hypothetical protein